MKMNTKRPFDPQPLLTHTISILLLLAGPSPPLTTAAGSSIRPHLHGCATQPVCAPPASVQPYNWGWELPLTAKSNRYIVNFTVGTQPSQSAAVFDTTANFTWIPCLFCRGCSGVYDPSKSTSYSPIPCGNECQLVPNGNCLDDHYCHYDYSVFGRWSSNGVAAVETFEFGGGKKTASFVFGCGNGVNSDNQHGLLAFGRNGMAVPTQLNAQKFAYCLGPSGGRLRFGNDFQLEGGAIPITPVAGLDNLYTVSLESFIIGVDSIPVPTQPMVFDVGSDLTVVPSNTLDALVSSVSAAVTLKTAQDPNGRSPLCYEGKVQDIVSMPPTNIGFRGSGGASMTLGPANLFLEVQETVVCLAFTRSRGDDDLLVMGNVVQRGHAIGYDAVQNALHIQPQDCSTF